MFARFHLRRGAAMVAASSVTCCSAEESSAAPASTPTHSPSPPCSERVLIVGAGLTGCLTAFFLRQLRPDVDIHLWERASYPSGRFGAVVRLGKEGEGGDDGEGDACVVADMGAQVLSCVDPRDERAQPSSGITRDALAIADGLVARLESEGWLTRAPDEALCATEERMVWEGALYYTQSCVVVQI